MVIVIGNWRPTALWMRNLKRPCEFESHHSPQIVSWCNWSTRWILIPKIPGSIPGGIANVLLVESEDTPFKGVKVITNVLKEQNNFVTGSSPVKNTKTPLWWNWINTLDFDSSAHGLVGSSPTGGSKLVFCLEMSYLFHIFVLNKRINKVIVLI